MQRFFFFVFIVVLLSACGTFRIEKRQYRGGWYLERSHKAALKHVANDTLIKHTESGIHPNDLFVSKTPTTLSSPLQNLKYVVEPLNKPSSSRIPGAPEKKERVALSRLSIKPENRSVDEESSQERKRLWFNLILLGALLLLFAALVLGLSLGIGILPLIFGGTGLLTLVGDLIYRPERIEKKKEIIQTHEPEKSNPIDTKYREPKEKRPKSSAKVFTLFLLYIILGIYTAVVVLFVYAFLSI